MARRIPTTMPFGKHKGEPFEDIPQSYMNWFLGTDDVAENRTDICIAMLRVLGECPSTMGIDPHTNKYVGPDLKLPDTVPPDPDADQWEKGKAPADMSLADARKLIEREIVANYDKDMVDLAKPVDPKSPGFMEFKVWYERQYGKRLLACCSPHYRPFMRVAWHAWGAAKGVAPLNDPIFHKDEKGNLVGDTEHREENPPKPKQPAGINLNEADNSTDTDPETGEVLF